MRRRYRIVARKEGLEISELVDGQSPARDRINVLKATGWQIVDNYVVRKPEKDVVLVE